MVLTKTLSGQLSVVGGCLVLLGLLFLEAASGSSIVPPRQRQLLKVNKGRPKGFTCDRQGPFPYVVSLRDPAGQHYCGGVLVSSIALVTAASCIHSFDPTIYIGGSTTSTPIEIRQTQDKIPHPRYTGDPTLGFNIAVIRMDGPTCVRAIPSLGGLNLPGQNNVFLGYGRTGDTEPFSDELLVGDFKTQPRNTCMHAGALPAGWVSTTGFCTKGPSNTGGLCEGDEGGPALHRPSQFVFQDQLVGIASHVSGSGLCKDPTSFGVFTNINHFVGWIQPLK